VDTSLNLILPLDMSWLQQITEADDNLLKFGGGGYVLYFAVRCPKLPVLDWRVTAGRRGNHKCSILGSSVHDVSCWRAADWAWEYNRRLASSNSTRIGGRHYAASCLYSSRLPSDCLVIDDEVVGDTPHANIILDVSPIGGCTHCKLVVMIRQLLTPEGLPLFECDTGPDIALNNINTIATYNLFCNSRRLLVQFVD
jgi:hypothetical protein